MPRTGIPRPAVRHNRLRPIYRMVSIGVIAALLAPSLLIFTGAMPAAKASGARPVMPVPPSVPPIPFDFGRLEAGGPFMAGTVSNAAFAAMASVIGALTTALVRAGPSLSAFSIEQLTELVTDVVNQSMRRSNK
jgi:hypothetical protein